VQIFEREASICGTNFLTGDFVLNMFQKSGLSYEDLAQIWYAMIIFVSLF
jgi:hypothetical protein